MRKWYCSQTTGKLVRTPLGVLFHAIFSLLSGRVFDLKWKVVWLCG